jgi:hypothetical protein
MATSLRRYSAAYATMTVAVYEPIVVRWVSTYALHVLASQLAWRAQKAKRLSSKMPTALALATDGFRARLPGDLATVPRGPVGPVRAAQDSAGSKLAATGLQRVQLAGYPDAVMVGDKVYPNGATSVATNTGTDGQSPDDAKRPGDPYLGLRSVPAVVDRRLGFVDDDFDLVQVRRTIATRLGEAVRAATGPTPSDLSAAIRDALVDIEGRRIFELFPVSRLEEALSPIGVAHYYRQHYFDVDEGVGPLEQAFTIAPKETLELVYETVRRQIHEELVEMGTETVTETAIEQKNLDEISDKVSSMVQRDTTASMSVAGSMSTPVWSAGGSASASMHDSTQRSRDQAARRVKEVTTRASERLTKSFAVKTRDLDELTTTNLTKRTIHNDADHPVSYGLRRVLRRVRVKVQDLGPRAVWQLYLRDPGSGLARSRFVHFREAAPIAPPEVPPGVPPRPQGGTDTGTSSTAIQWDTTRQTYAIALAIPVTPDRVVTAICIDSLTDLGGGGKEDPSPAPKNTMQWGQHWDPTAHVFTVMIAVHPGDSTSVTVTYSYTWDPSQAVLDEWEAKRAQAVAEATEEFLNAQFERAKDLISERSKIRPRPANDLRTEERYEVMNRLVSHLFGRGDDPSEPTPLEVETFHRLFELERLFVYTHPSWWRPRRSRGELGNGRQAYEITADSDPAPLGSSLGWLIQLDGDARRNEFLNSPWVRVCLPISPGREREAIEWLRVHVEGDQGYDAERGPLHDLVESLAQLRNRETALGVNGPDYVKVDSTPGAPDDPARPEAVYPIIDEFEVTVPTDGFVYDELVLQG